ncbi:MAG: magnesium transporter [Verrucomicrobia bacterium]|nr:magnesium transporter [Verrucomicrobiota bacterium]MCH8512697.1 magnesium transporter [Kiritimatiellia bacterium]
MLLPVVDKNGRILGVISFDEAMKILSENVAEKLAGLGGGTSEESFFTPPLRAVRKELVIGLINGLALGLLFAGVATLLQGNPLIGGLAGIALGVNVLVAGLVGGCLPFLIKRMGKDPAMMTGPVLTTITDITGVTIYLGLCSLFLTGILNAP